MQFEFQYAIIKIVARIEENILKVKQGIRNFELPIQEIQFLYAGKMPPGDFLELIVVTRNASGKEKKFRFYSNEGEPGFSALVDELVRQKPASDLRSLAREEALAKLKVADTAKIAFWAVPALVIAIMFALAFPFLIHGLDRGNATISVEEFVTGTKTDTRNLTITGMALDQGLQDTTTRKGKKTVRLYFPLIGADWKEGDEVHMVVETGDLSDEQLAEVLSRKEFTGVLRNVLWEGLSGKNQEFFVKEYNMNLSKEVQLLELDNKGMDLILFSIIMGTTIVIMFGVMFYLRRKMG
ncbi:MAG: hypothetical protein K8S54_15830 [Spirochaetia bacterium]|nr:hypothetical protein [Spirochaetia bacterium]